jgi:hypothetical protein
LKVSSKPSSALATFTPDRHGSRVRIFRTRIVPGFVGWSSFALSSYDTISPESWSPNFPSKKNVQQFVQHLRASGVVQEIRGGNKYLKVCRKFAIILHTGKSTRGS